MAHYVTDFSGYTTGEFPSDWTKIDGSTTGLWTVEEVAEATGGKVLRQNGGLSQGVNEMTWNLIDSDLDNSSIEILARARITDFSQPPHMLLEAHSWGGVDGNSDLAISGGSAGTVAHNLTTGTWCWLRFRSNSTERSLKFWLDSDTEPETWTLTTTGTTGAGKAGFHRFYAGEIEYDLYAVATGGDVATTSPSTNTLTTPSSINKSETFNAVISGDVTATGATLSDSTATVNQTLGDRSYDSTNDETTYPVTVVRGNLPYGTGLTLKITLDDTSVVSNSIDFVSTDFVIDIVDPVTTIGSIFEHISTSEDAPETGMQVESEKDLNPDGTLKDVNDTEPFKVTLWKDYANGWGSETLVQIFQYNSTNDITLNQNLEFTVYPKDSGDGFSP